MTSRYGATTAEIADKITRQAVWMTFAVALLYSVSALQYLADDMLDPYLTWIQRGLGVVVVLIALFLVPLAIKKRSDRNRRHATASEGFINDVAKDSCVFSWGLTILLLIFLDIVAEGLLSQFPSEFTTEVIKALLLGTFSIRFYFLNRSSHCDDKETGFVQ